MDITLVAAAAERVTLAASAQPIVHAGVIDKVTTMSAEAEVAVKAVVTVVLIAFVVYMTVRDGFRLSRLITSGLVAGLCAWLVWGGVFSVRDMVGEDLASPATSVTVRHVDPSTALV